MDRPASSVCWCGSTHLDEFSADYLHCSACETLVARNLPGPEIASVQDDSVDLYGRSYWYDRQKRVHGYPNLEERAWLDIPERCVHWLKALLRYKRPPGDVLEIGCAHGGFVALLQWAGFRATGLELSPSVVEFARKTFAIPVLQGPLEQQDIPPESMDVIALLDVLEHLPDPVKTMRRCVQLLRSDGVLLVQTPKYPAGIAYEKLNSSDDIFLKQLKTGEHLFLFSEQAIRSLFSRLGVSLIRFEPAIYAYYDQFFFAMKSETVAVNNQCRDFLETPSGRMVQGLLDAAGEREELRRKWQETQSKEALALEQLHALRQHVNLLDEDRNKGWAEAERWHAALDSANTRLEEMSAELKRLQTRADASETRLKESAAELEQSSRVHFEKDRLIGEQREELIALSSESALIQAKYANLSNAVEGFRASMMGRALRKLGLILPQTSE